MGDGMKGFVKTVLAVASAAVLAASVGVAAGSTARLLKHGPPALLLTHTKSLNWSGYAAYDSSSSFTTVGGSWGQPTATCTRGKTTYASFWVGIDGYSSSSVEQIGTEADCVHGKPSYYAWYEMYPAAPVNLDTTTYPVSPGDTITASVDSSTGYLTISDSSGWSFTTPSLSFSEFDLSSAEWVAEAPALCSPGHCSIQPLTNFDTVTFTNSTANGHAINYGGWSNDPMTMVNKNGRIVRATPSDLTSNGKGFTITWSHS